MLKGVVELGLSGGVDVRVWRDGVDGVAGTVWSRHGRHVGAIETSPLKKSVGEGFLAEMGREVTIVMASPVKGDAEKVGDLIVEGGGPSISSR